jgi:protein ImuB
LEAEPAEPRAAQNGLFIPQAPEPEKLEITLARLKALVGDGHVGSPVLVDTHRPGAFRMESFRGGGTAARPTGTATATRDLAFRVIRPPRPARVQMASGQPVHVQPESGGSSGHVVSSAGPWRTSGDWWTTSPWARDEWDVALSNGALYRIYCEQGRWFVEGCYD